MSAATRPAARTRPRVLIAMVVLGALGALGIRVVGGGSDGPTTIGQLASADTDPGAAPDGATVDPATSDPAVTAVPAATVPAASTTTALPVATVPGGALATIPWTTGADGAHREPFTNLSAPTDPSSDPASAPASDAVSDAGTDPADDAVAAVATPSATVPVPTVVGTIDAGGRDGAVPTPDTATTVPAETTTTRSPTLGLVTRPAGGYWLFQADGAVFASRPDTWYGDLRAVPLSSPVVGMQATPTGKGYYLVSRDGGVFAFGDAVYDGSIPDTLARQLDALLSQGYLAPTTTVARPVGP